MEFPSLSTRACLLLALGGAVLTIGVSAGIQWWGITYLREVIASVQHGDVALAEAVGSLRDDLLQLRRYEKDVFINMTSTERRDRYWSKWDGTLLNLRYDLTRTRSLAPPSAGAGLQEFADSVAAYRSAFAHTYDLIRAGVVVTPQQANEQIAEAKAAAHEAERQLVEIERHAQLRMAQFDDPVNEAGWVSLALNLVLLVSIGGPLAGAVRQKSHAVAME